MTLFCLPETLYSRKIEIINDPNYKAQSFTNLLLFKRGKLGGRNLKATDFLKPFIMLKYISIFVPGLYYMTCFGYGTVLFAATGAALFREFYDFDTAQTGLMLSIPLLIGCLIGEFNAGWVTDYMVYRYAKKHDGHRLPEARLDAIWLALLIPVGVIIEGVCLTHFETASWVGTAFGMGIACLGLQVATTVVYAYTTDVSSFHPIELHWTLIADQAIVLQAAIRRDLQRPQHLPADLRLRDILLRHPSRQPNRFSIRMARLRHDQRGIPATDVCIADLREQMESFTDTAKFP